MDPKNGLTTEEQNFLRKNNLEDLSSLDEIIDKMIKIIAQGGKNKQPYGFERKLDASTANNALSFTGHCEGNIDQIRVASTQNALMNLLGKDFQDSFKNSHKDIDDKLSSTISGCLKSIKGLLDSDSFSEAEQGMENLSRVQRELAGYYKDDSITETSGELRRQLDTIVTRISKRYEGMTYKNFSLDPPKDLLTRLEIVASRGDARYRQAYNAMLRNVEAIFNTAINEARQIEFDKRAAEIYSLKCTLYCLPNNLEMLYRKQLDDESNLCEIQEKSNRSEIDRALQNMNDADHPIAKILELVSFETVVRLPWQDTESGNTTEDAIGC
ncbi:unnamed protein product [Rotaria sp. Silwood2]|nr:unnamed protein product [Rotaria sp. Silwood2]CAF4345523.1 unnamed protein product [Rotaria sp. Silwood2]